MKLLKYLILMCIFLSPCSYSVHATLADDTLRAIEESYLVIHQAEQAGGDVEVAIMMLDQASRLVAEGSENSLRDAIILANEAKSLALSIEQTSRTNIIYASSRLLVFLIISLLTMVFIRRYGNRVYFSLWASIKSYWRIEKT